MNFAENLEMLVQADDLPKKILSRRHYPYTDFSCVFREKPKMYSPMRTVSRTVPIRSTHLTT